MESKQISKSQAKAEKLIGQYQERLREIKSIETSEISLEELEELCNGLELEMNTLDTKKASILSVETRASIKHQYLMIIQRNGNILKEVGFFTQLFPKMNYPINPGDCVRFKRELSVVSQRLNKLNSEPSVSLDLKQRLNFKYDTEIQTITNFVVNNRLPVEYRDSIDLIEKTLAEPELYSLPSLIMWRKTAEKKIEKIENQLEPKLPKPIAQTIVWKYEFLIKQLRAEILKLRTYPIPEPWCSCLMRKGVTHMIEGEFIFFVHPRIMEDMRPLNLSDRDILPGGLTRQDYNSRMNRINMESALAIEELEARTASGMETKLEWFEDSFTEIEDDVNFAFTELPLLYRDGRTLEYLVNKNQDDELLKDIYEVLLRKTRHFYNNRINIPSVAIDYKNDPMQIAPPKSERNIPVASGIDRGATEGLQLVTPASVVVYRNIVLIADKYGHSISYYRYSDLEAIGSYHHTTADNPISLSVFKDSLYVCYSTNELVQFSFSWNEELIAIQIEFETCMQIQQVCCTASNDVSLFVGTLKPSLILIDTETLQVDQEYTLDPMRYHTNKNRYPWLQDMKATNNCIICLFTGSPSPLQMFTLRGELFRSVLTEDKIVGAYHFNLFWNPVTEEWRIYITDFWDNGIKVFDMEGQFIETFSEKGFGLGQIFHPTGVFVEESGFITICDMKEDNCLQRL